MSESFKPRNELREPILNRALKCYVVLHVVGKYQVVALMVLWKMQNYNNLFSKRNELDSLSKQVKAVVLVISCVTCFKNEEVDVGFVFWIGFDWPQYGV